MRNYKIIIPLVVLLIICTSGCSKEFSPEADLEDKPVVYSIINFHDSKHYVRISRSFIQAISGESISAPVYNPDSLDVFLEVYRFGQKVGYTIFLSPEYVEKDTGRFEADSQLIYSTDVDLVGDSECRLTILNRQNGESYSSSCNVFSLKEFKPLVVSNLTRLNFSSLSGVFFYEVYCFFHYAEVSATDTVFKTVRYPIGTIINCTKEENKEMSISLERPDWWGFLGSHISVDPDVKRYAFERPLEFRILVGDQYLFDYRRSFSGFETMIHTGQSFSNIQGGFGIFCSYDDKTIFFQAMLPNWYDKLAEQAETKELNFLNFPWQ